MNEFWSDCIRGLTPYTPGEQPGVDGLAKLNTNENPYPPSPAVLDVLRRALNGDLRLYPDPDGSALRQAIAEKHGLTRDHVFLGNGSDEVLAHAFLALLKHDRPILLPDVTYSFYPVWCALYGIDHVTVPLDERLQIDVAGYAQPNGGVVLANPNAPTGCALDAARILALVDRCPDSVVVVDEAYVDFGAETVAPHVDEHPNLLVVQTLSKSRSLAGLRVGMAIGHPALIEALNVVKSCFNAYPLDRLALAGAEAAIRDTEYLRITRRRIMRTRDVLTHGLAELGFAVLPSKANFVLARHPSHDAARLQRTLRRNGVLVRHFRAPRIDQYLRISVGTDEECRRLIDVLRTVVRAA